MSFTPKVSPHVIALAPDFHGRNIILRRESASAPDSSGLDGALNRARDAVLADQAKWAEAHLDAWRDVYRRFGAKPQRTPCSAESLRKRLLRDGAIPRIDPVVDLYNAISLQYALPVGGENLAAYDGSPYLTRATGEENFDTMKDGQSHWEKVSPGEVIWRDKQGATCRRWNWRQGVRTRLDSSARQMWFVLEALEALPADRLQQAAEHLVQGLRQMYPDAAIELSPLITDSCC